MVLHNPMTGGTDWFHGTPHQFERFRLSESDSHLDPDDLGNRAWNTLLGHHFTAHHDTAEDFASGVYKARSEPNLNSRIVHARLHISNPRVYGSESEMVQHALTVPHDPGEHSHHAYLRWLHENGHDGVVYGNEVEGPRLHPCAIALHPDDIEITQHHLITKRCGVNPDSLYAEGHVLDQWAPSERLFSPTKTTLDPTLFDSNRMMRANVRNVLMDKMVGFLRDHGWSKGWHSWMRMYLAGSQASYWWGNRDFDILVGIEYDRFRTAFNTDASNDEITQMFNVAFNHDWNDEHWHPSFDPDEEWHLTGYVNHDSWDIRRIKPYAAYEVVSQTWFVQPISEPLGHHFDETFFYLAEGYAQQIRSALKMPEPVRTKRLVRLWHFLHTDRSRAFGPQGGGAFDRGNAVEKYLDQAQAGNGVSLWQAMVDARFPTTIAKKRVPCPACSGTGEQGTGHECYACDGTGLKDEYDPSIDNANPENGLLVGRDDAKGIEPVEAAVHPYAQQDWYHGGLLGHSGHNLYDDKTRNSGINWLHVGTKKAALDRIDPEGYTGGSYEWPMQQHKHLYRVQLVPGARVCPHVHTGDMETLDANDPGSDSFDPTCRHPDGGEYDAHPYVNEHEDSGNISLAVRSNKVRVMEDLGRHPRWSEPGYGAKWQGHEAAVRTLTKPIGVDSELPEGIMVHLAPPAEHIEPLLDDVGEHPDVMHMTLAYLGKMSDHSEEQIRNLPEVVQSWAEGQQPIDAMVQGVGTFVNTDNPNEDERHVLWATADIPGGPAMHVSLVKHLQENGYKPYDNHGWMPHITLGYSKHHYRFLPKLEEKKPWPIREVWLAIGPRWESFPLGS